VLPHLAAALEVSRIRDHSLRLDADRDMITLAYRSIVPPRLHAVTRTVVLEFGGRSSISPNSVHTVRPEVAALVKDLELPEATVHVLAAERTFWEKVTLIHAEIGRSRPAEALAGMSRHWHDVAVLADGEIGRRALSQRDLLEDVVRYKQTFFRFAGADYEDCLSGKLRLLPPAPMEAILGADHADMVARHFFDGQAPDFNLILRRLKRLQDDLNVA
jgi:hypothetical protein